VLWIDAETVTELLPMRAAIDALELALTNGLDPSADPPRVAVDTQYGQMLLMPTEIAGWAGVKIVSIAPGNAERGLPRIQGSYLLLDAETLSPVALMDGSAITSLRTPAMSAVAVRHLAAADASRLVVFGTGPQAWGHVEALRAVRPLTEVVVVGRDPGRTQSFVDRVAETGVLSSAGLPDAVADADLVVCATTSAERLFDGLLIPDGACVVAVGSHQPERRELDADLVGRASVVVEDVSTALREAGDVVRAIAEGALAAESLLTIDGIVTGRTSADPTLPRVYKSVGMAWQDLVVAVELHRRHRAA
jgi:ornithine cyclodeaminase/alanine dehydrogenase-like protein (mu-crystallin family)